MSLTRATLTTLFPASQSARPVPAAQSAQIMKRPLRFLVRQESVYVGIWDSVKALCVRVKRPTSGKASRFFSESLVTRVELDRTKLLLSFLLHILLVLTMLNLPLILPASDTAKSFANYRQRAITYRLPLLVPLKMLPRVVPQGPGGRPGSGSQANQLPAVGRMEFAGRWTVASKPLHPDNSRQTIHFDPPPDLRITQEMKLPNILFGNLNEPKRPVIQLELKNVKPVPEKQQASEAVPAPDLAAPINSLTTLPQVTTSHPLLPLQVLTASKPILKSGAGESSVSIPDNAGFPGNGNGLVVLSTSPAWSSLQPSPPLGNREGEFTISPSAGEGGSPGGDSQGVIGGGTGTNSGNTGGDGSTRKGPGNWGGGGGDSSAHSGSLTIGGPQGATESVGVMRSNLIASMIYPVNSAVLPPKSQLVVSAGPMGGGGLNVYGALHCGKIYTVFLEMPGKNWTLQFCEHGGQKENTGNERRSTVVHLEEALVPPSAESKFDFRRLPVPEKNSHKLIVLKGVMEKDGTVDKLEIYQGILSEMDEAARLALSRWKFRPATRAKLPVAVDVLVGIPTEIPRQRETK